MTEQPPEGVRATAPTGPLDGVPNPEDIEDADIEKRIDEDPDDVANATDPDGVPDTDVSQDGDQTSEPPD